VGRNFDLNSRAWFGWLVKVSAPFRALRLPKQKSKGFDSKHERRKEQIMKTRNTRTKLIAMAMAVGMLAAVWCAWGTPRAEAVIAIIVPTDSFGVAQGQTARLNVVNRREDRGIIINWRFLDAGGNVVAQSDGRVQIEPGHTMSFDLSGDALERARDAFGRIQLGAVVRAFIPPGEKNLGVSVEVFDNDTGKTTFALSPQPQL
jgi:hypothetical protein